MRIDEQDVSPKNEFIVVLLTLFFGTLGAHRFYVGRWISGIVYFLICNTSALFRILGYAGIDLFKSSIVVGIAYAFALVAILYDIYALYSEAFHDGHGKIIVSKGTKEENGVQYKSEFPIADVVMIICLFVIFIVLRFIILPELTGIYL